MGGSVQYVSMNAANISNANSLAICERCSPYDCIASSDNSMTRSVLSSLSAVGCSQGCLCAHFFQHCFTTACAMPVPVPVHGMQLIEQVKLHGLATKDGTTEVAYGTLFEETDNIFEALSGLLITAKKHKVYTCMSF